MQVQAKIQGRDQRERQAKGKEGRMNKQERTEQAAERLESNAKDIMERLLTSEQREELERIESNPVRKKAERKYRDHQADWWNRR